MSIKTSIPDNFIPQRGARRPYVLDLPYREAMRLKPAKSDPNYDFRKQSEFKKPYQSPDYHQMEYGLDYPWFSFDWPYIGMGGDFGPGYQADVDQGLWSANFLCLASPCHCEHYERCFDAGCTWEIVGIKVLSGQITVRGRNYFCVKGSDGYKGTAQIQILQRFGPGELTDDEIVYGSHIISVPFCGEVECCSEGDLAMAWDAVTSDDTINQGETATVAVTGDNSPFDWTVSGTGFSLADATTDGLSNILIAASDACGVATITVTGCDGTSVSGEVRSTADSQWTWVSDDAEHSCWTDLNCLPDDETCPQTDSDTYQCEVVSGSTKKVYDFKWLACGSEPCSCECDMGDPPCASPTGDCKAYKSSNWIYECA